jgi:hypothetical protein
MIANIAWVVGNNPRFNGPGIRIVRRWSMFIAIMIFPPLVLVLVPLEVYLINRRRRKVRA